MDINFKSQATHSPPVDLLPTQTSAISRVFFSNPLILDSKSCYFGVWNLRAGIIFPLNTAISSPCSCFILKSPHTIKTAAAAAWYYLNKATSDHHYWLLTCMSCTWSIHLGLPCKSCAVLTTTTTTASQSRRRRCQFKETLGAQRSITINGSKERQRTAAECCGWCTHSSIHPKFWTFRN